MSPLRDPGPPALDSAFGKAVTELTRYLSHYADLLAALPAPADRSDTQMQTAAILHRTCRQARRRFLHLHADTVYSHLTDGGRERPRLAELAYAATDLLPGLSPTREQITEERRHDQAAKEGHEIDQGILFHALLNRPATGTHLVDSMRHPTPRALGLTGQLHARRELRLDTIALQCRDHTAEITLHNDHCLNAGDDTLIEDLETAVDLALLDKHTRVCILRGGQMTHPAYRGRRVFNSGINLTELHHGHISFVDFVMRREIAVINKIQRGLLPRNDDDPDTGEKPWIAVVDTFSHGAGLQLLPLFDRVIAAADVYFSLRTVEVGVLPGMGTLRLTRAFGGRLARQIILNGRRFSARSPEARHVCDDIVEPEHLDTATASAATALANPAVVANRRMLHLAEEPPDTFRHYAAAFAHEQARRLYSPEMMRFLTEGWTHRPR